MRAPTRERGLGRHVGESRRDRGARLVGIEGLRAIAATSILVYHVYVYGAPDGQRVDMGPLGKVFDNLRAGVTLFFVLSGFLLYRVFVSAALRDRPMPSVRNYFRNRALRIVPAYVAVLLAVALVFEHELLTRPLQLGANLLFLQNYIPAYIGTSPDAAGIAPAWSIVIEVSFYLVLPVLGYIAIRLARRHGIVGSAGARRADGRRRPCGEGACAPARRPLRRAVDLPAQPAHACGLVRGRHGRRRRAGAVRGRPPAPPELVAACGGGRCRGTCARRDEALLRGDPERAHVPDANRLRLRAPARGDRARGARERAGPRARLGRIRLRGARLVQRLPDPRSRSSAASATGA